METRKPMTRHNPENERIKRRYFTYLKEARRYSEASIDTVAKALHRFEADTKFRSFKSFHIEQAVAFKRRLREQVNVATGKPLSKATINSTLSASRNFFHWLADQPGFRKRIGYGDGEYFNLTEKEMRIAKATREQPVPSVEQIKHVLATMPATTVIEKRNRALIAFTLLTGARDGALASFKIRHVDLIEGRVDQDARDVNTKFSKTFATWFFPVGDETRQIIECWIEFLKTDLQFGPDEPLFPATKIGLGANHQFEVVGLDRKHWSNAGPIRKIFRQAFEAAGLPYFNPHSFRNTLAQLGERTCRTPEEFKAWSQNLGHDKVMTTFSSYGAVASGRQATLIRSLGKPQYAENDALVLIEDVLRTARLKRL
jgi:integrase